MQPKLPPLRGTMINPIHALAKQLVINGYATDIKSVPYGLTKQNTYEVFVEDVGWQRVNPFGNEAYCSAQYYALKLRNILSIMLTYLDEDQLLHFRKICKPINEMTVEQLGVASGLVERTLDNVGIDHKNIIANLLDSIDIDK